MRALPGRTFVANTLTARQEIEIWAQAGASPSRDLAADHRVDEQPAGSRAWDRSDWGRRSTSTSRSTRTEASACTRSSRPRTRRPDERPDQHPVRGAATHRARGPDGEHLAPCRSDEASLRPGLHQEAPSGASILPDNLIARYAITLPASRRRDRGAGRGGPRVLEKGVPGQVHGGPGGPDVPGRRTAPGQHRLAMGTRGWWQQRQSAAEASIADAIVEAESVLDGSSGEGGAFFTDLTAGSGR